MAEMLRQVFFQYALLAGVLAAELCSLVGVYVLLTRMVFVGLTLAQLASAGVALALLLHVSPLLVSLGTVLLGVLFFAQLSVNRYIPLEGVIGASYIFSAALGLICLAINPFGEARALQVLFGNILSVQEGEIVALAVILALLLSLHVIFYKEFLFVAFDYETALAHGLAARWWNGLLYLTIGVAIAFAMHSMGVLLVFTWLLVPALTARLLARRMASLFTLAAAFGTLVVPIGLYLAFRLDLPSSAMIAAAAVLLLLFVLLGKGVYGLYQSRSVASLVLVVLCGLPTMAVAQTDAPPQRLRQMEHDLRQMRDSIGTLRATIRAQQELLQRQEELLRQQERDLQQLRRDVEQVTPAPPPASPPVVAAPSAPATPRLPGGLLLNPEMRVEGNMIANKTFGLARDAEAEGFPSDRLSLKNVEIGFRAAVDPFAIFEAVFEGQRLIEIDLEGEREGEESVELEIAHLTLARLPLRLRGRLGLMRTSFGEYNDDDPEEFPQIDPPNVIVHLFGEEGEGWRDVGFNLNYQFGNPWSDKLTHLLWFGIYSGENNTAFDGGQFDRLVYFGRAETFFELGTRAGAELGISVAAGQRRAGAIGDDDDGANQAHGIDEDADRAADDALTTFLLNLHFELDWQPAIHSLERGFSFLGELFYAYAERTARDIRSFGGYALAQYRLDSRWALGVRFDAAECPGFDNSLCARINSDRPIEERFEWALSPIVSFSPSRFLTLRLQYKHTNRNYAENSNEIMAQALFIIGYERPEPF